MIEQATIDRINLNDRKAFLTRRETAKRLDISFTTLAKLVKQGRLHPVRQGKHWIRFPVEDVERYIQQLLREAEDGTKDGLPRWP